MKPWLKRSLLFATGAIALPSYFVLFAVAPVVVLIATAALVGGVTAVAAYEFIHSS